VGGARQIVTFTNIASTGEPIELNVSGDWIDRHATIKMGEVVVAEIRRRFFNAREMLGGADTVCFFPFGFLWCMGGGYGRARLMVK